MSPLSWRSAALVVLVLTVWIALAGALAMSNTPWSNEAWCAIPAVNLLTRGYMGTTVLASRGTWLVGVERHTYWIMPLHVLVQAAWYKLVGFSLFRQRLLSILFGAGALVSWFLIVLRLSGTYAAAVMAVLIVGFERNFLNGAANGRMDMMAAALGAAGLAAFLQLRERSPRTSLWVGHSLAAAAVFTHPCGVLFVAALLVTMRYTMTRGGPARWRIGDLALAALPYLLALVLWGAYIAQAPSDFRSQFFGNISGFAGEYLQRTRSGGILAPWSAIWWELKLRYLLPFGFGALGTIAGAASAVWLSLCALAALLALFHRKLRRQPGVQILAASGLTVFLIMALFEGMKFQHYLVYSLPFAGALAAVVGAGLWRRGSMRVGLCAALTAMIVPQAAGALRHSARNPLRTEFLPVAGWIQEKLGPEDRLIAPAEFGYVLGFTDSISDDVRLGFYTGVRPRFVVTSNWYRDWIGASAQREPAVYRHIQAVLHDGYRPVLAAGEYLVYEKNTR
jgi:4-amino-4-deoxy-L-arabinose transferase-like glycosyltransferase